LAEVYLGPDGAPTLEVVKKPHTAAALRALALREDLASKAIDKGAGPDKAYAQANAEALKRLRLPADTRMPPERDYDYVTTIARAELQVEIGAEARVALETLRRKCP
jgi:hypothetical protein